LLMMATKVFFLLETVEILLLIGGLVMQPYFNRPALGVR